MNSSMHFIQPEQAASARIPYGANRCEFDPEVVADKRYLHRPATHAERAWLDARCTLTAVRRAVTARFALGEHGLPHLPHFVADSDHEPRVIRFVEGPDSPIRTRALEARVSQLGGPRGRKLFVRCKQGELDKQLVCARARAAELCAQAPLRPVVLGIDGADQWLTSATAAAFQVQAILDAGAGVVCAVDPRYGDSRLLTFHLRTLGIMVIREPHLPDRSGTTPAVPTTPRLSPDAGTGVPPRRFPSVSTAALAAYVAELSNPGAQLARNNPASQREPDPCWAGEGEVPSAPCEYERAYRNDFAIHRLLRERNGF
ncbi:hypothetical protein [Paraburkholderia sp. 32]|uniref:hypothetical protein n=1 Tax=Paraburkholderia sp. 32 TaxID=2991057 RepID=UPI003D194BDD